MDAALEAMVRELHDREAIRQIVHRYSRGVLRFDCTCTLVPHFLLAPDRVAKSNS